MSQHPPTEALRGAERGPQSAVCAGISALVRQRWGRGPRRSRAYWAGPDALLVLLDDAHTESERTLLGSGHDAEVLAGRRLLAEIAEPELCAIAESAMGRPVLAVLAQTSLDPPLSAVVFALAPANGRGPRQDEPVGDALCEALERSSAPG